MVGQQSGDLLVEVLDFAVEVEQLSGEPAISGAVVVSAGKVMLC